MDGAGLYFSKAIAAGYAQPNRRNVDLAADIANLAQVQENRSDLKGAAENLAKAAKLALDAGGNQNGVYWYAVAQQAKLLDFRGEWKPALSLLDTLEQQRSGGSPSENVRYQVRLLYASCRIREGSGADMVPSLEATLAVLTARPSQADDRQRALLTLADAYDQAGHADKARVTFRLAGSDVIAAHPNSAADLTRSARWASFLIEHGQPEAAATVFDAIIAKQPQWGRDSPGPAQAWAGRARLYLAHGAPAAALAASNASFVALDTIRVMYERPHTRQPSTNTQRRASGDRRHHCSHERGQRRPATKPAHRCRRQRRYRRSATRSGQRKIIPTAQDVNVRGLLGGSSCHHVASSG